MQTTLMHSNERPQPLPVGVAVPMPQLAAAAIPGILSGSRALQRLFLLAPLRTAGRGMSLNAGNGSEPEVMLLRSGFACRSLQMNGGRRAIIDILAPGDIAGLDHVVVARPLYDFNAASRLTYHSIGATDMRQLMADPQIALRVYALLAEARWRTTRLAVSIGQLDARARICLLLLDVHDRLQRRGLLLRSSFNLPLTQEQIADHLGLTIVHVNRTLRRMRQEQLAIVDRQVVIILDLDRMRSLVDGMPPTPDLPEPALPA